MELNECFSWKGAIPTELRAGGSSSCSKFENNPHQNWKIAPSLFTSIVTTCITSFQDESWANYVMSLKFHFSSKEHS